jgi:hypothetical protein
MCKGWGERRAQLCGDAMPTLQPSRARPIALLPSILGKRDRDTWYLRCYKGCSSIWGRLVGLLPDLIEVVTHDRGSNGNQTFNAWATPAHPGAVEARAETLAPALDHAAANREAIFPQFLVLHATKVVLQVTGFATQVIREWGMRLSRLKQSSGDLIGVSFKQRLFLRLAPLVGRWRALALQQTGTFAKCSVA